MDMAPQSNQRGIETQVRQQRRIRLLPGLNRTSVGLKHEHSHYKGMISRMPQSNQRGIETHPGSGLSGADPGPQSNQRGIETRALTRRLMVAGAPQSNQRGIETVAELLRQI